jgi:tyrosine-protein kinase Etk/Wzc
MALRNEADRMRDHDISRYDEKEIYLLDFLIVMAKHKKILARVTGTAAVVSLIVALFLPNIYVSTAKILPPQQSQSAATAILGQLGPLAGLAGQNLGIKASNSGELYIAMLQSRTVADNLIKRFDLMHVYEAKRFVDAREKLAGNTDITLGKEGLIAVSVSDKDAKFAAALANGYVEELIKVSQGIAIGEASQRRLFFENQLQTVKEQLANAEVDLKRTQEASGLIQMDSQARAIIEAVATVRGQIAAREVQLHAMRSFATEHNADVILAEQELAGLRIQLEKLEKNSNSGKGDIQVATSRVPEVGLEYVRKLRNVKYYETMFEVLAKQFEVAKLDEAKNSAVIQVLDEAVVSEKKSKPFRSLIVFLTTLFSFVIATVWVFFIELKTRVTADPDQADRLQILNAYLFG